MTPHTEEAEKDNHLLKRVNTHTHKALAWPSGMLLHAVEHFLTVSTAPAQ